MAHYVDLDKAQVIMTQRGCGKSALLDTLRKLPEEDAAPVKHGYWILWPNWVCECDQCHEHFTLPDYEYDRYEYCPSCGAKIEGPVRRY